ncbi:MAG: hypothetical protein AB7L94_21700 [Kofleriaceae bacterium]
MQQLSISLLALGLVTGCVASEEGRPTDDEQLDIRSGGKADGQSCDLEALSARDYYQLFAYRELESTSHHYYRVGLSWDLVATLDNGDSVDLNIYFLADDRVIVEYSELHSLNASESEVLKETVIVTRAHVDESTREITIDGVGAGTPMVHYHDNGRCTPGIDFRLTADQRTPGLAGDSTLIYAGTSTGYVIDPDHLDQVPSETARRYFEEDVASGKIQIVRY